MNKLSRREKLLIYICLLLFIGVGGIYFLIIPAADKAFAQEDILSEKQMRIAQIDSQIMLIPQLEVKLGPLDAKMSEVSEQFYPFTVNEKLDTLITSLMLKHKLTPHSLTMSDTEVLAVLSFGMSEEDVKDGATPNVMSNIFHIEATGSELQVMEFVDAIGDLPYLRMESFELELDGLVKKTLAPTAKGRNISTSFTASIVAYMY